MMYHIIMSCLGIAVIAYVIPLSTLATGGRYTSMMLIPIACSRCFDVVNVAYSTDIFPSWAPDHALQDAQPPHGPTLPQACGRRRHDERPRWIIQHLGLVPLLCSASVLRRLRLR